MITVKKDAIKYKDANGQMQSAGVLCSVGTFGENLANYATKLEFFSVVNLPENVEIELLNIKELNKLFWGCKNVKKIKILLSEETIYQSSQVFNYANSLECIDFHDRVVHMSICNYLLDSCFALKEIKGVLDLSNAWSSSNFATGCKLLEEIRFVEKSIVLSITFIDSSELSDESIQSIVDGLADLTGQTTQTLTLHADVKAKLTDAQIATITENNWTLA